MKERIEERTAAAEVSTADLQDVRIEHGEKAGWLSPIALEPPRKKVREKQTARRASNKFCLSMTLDEYLNLVDWTDRQMRKDKMGTIPRECGPILEHLAEPSADGAGIRSNSPEQYKPRQHKPGQHKDNQQAEVFRPDVAHFASAAWRLATRK